jgi:hypothetical protein
MENPKGMDAVRLICWRYIISGSLEIKEELTGKSLLQGVRRDLLCKFKAWERRVFLWEA